MIGQARYGVKETVIGTVIHAELRYYQTRRVFEVIVDDKSGTLTAKWFMGNPT